MWAQGLTIGVVIAAGLLTHSQRQKEFETRMVDHSWKDMLEESQREEAQAAAVRRVTLPTRHVPAAVPASTA